MVNAMNDTSSTLLETIRQLAGELQMRPREAIQVTLDNSLERDLGFDSLGRVELFTRIEQVFGISLPERVLTIAETPRDLLQAVLAASPATAQPANISRDEAPAWVQAEPTDALTLPEVLEWHVRTHPERTHITLQDAEGNETTLTYAALRDGAEEIAAGLLERGLLSGQSVALMLPTSREYFFCFLGVLLAGGVPVPIYPPARPSQIEDHLRRHAGILSNALATILITVAEAKPVARLLQAQVESLRRMATADELATSGRAPGIPLKAENIALLQYTSGSTGNPKGTVLTHANLLANIRAMGKAVQATSTDVFVSWLPLYHDMGLIGAWLGSLYHAFPLVVMSPLTFLARPERWLWAIHRHRGTLSASPNFGYELCLRKIPDAALAGLDLSSWRMAFNGAEPVSPETIARFAQRYNRYGLRPQAIAPVYGLAECSVGLSFPPPGRGPLIDCIRRDSFMRTGHAEPAGSGEEDVLRIPACGRPLPGHEIRIVDATGRELGERVEGHLEFKGPSATGGYFRNPEQTRLLFHGEWLDSGDFAYQAEGDIYLTGRSKDIIIRAGRNIYPYELEEAVGDIPGIRKGCVAVFGSPDPATGTERLVVLAETRETSPVQLEALRNRINTLTLDILGMPADNIMLAPIHSVLKTSSGKIRRAACRELFEKGATPTRAVWWQLIRLAWAGILPQMRRGIRVVSDVCYAAYTWALFWMLAPLTWLVAALLPRPAWNWAASHAIARLYARLCATPLVVRGLENLSPEVPCVLVSNHASYLDGIVLVAALPGELSSAGYFSFVAKRELLDSFVSRTYLRRIGSDFVERFESQRSLEDVKQVAHSLQSGCSPIFFPEGTFSRISGLTPFRMGAFVVAAEAGAPVVPVSIRGTRSILRDGHWFPRRGIITVTIGKPIAPEGKGWAAAIRLRNTARAEISRRCGEPDLAPGAPEEQAEV
ncbi:MAG: acyl-phosphate glycerol 3-phosphate acyltransferase [Gallionellales bacterium RIFCSPLOWO2_02_FULL_57_47]|nr:MAG: acyl-phosphate glycerol 3-phosphate acyltransferase [Gallionellales bacterium RIFCSPLOWO2_02_FULL_57_47]OGT18348.1 MAG: acyl-phosphate glycerol 3-phosphate acyltransferase [Gallionellales bacterium RIFCSPHIGHO2_02_FULL_57_16]